MFSSIWIALILFVPLEVMAAAVFRPYSPAAPWYRPLAYWNLPEEPSATTRLQSHGAAPYLATNGGVYRVHHGTPNLIEYTIHIGTTPWTCPIPGSPATIRIPQGAHGQPDPGDHDRHIMIIDLDRNITYSLYSWSASDGPQGGGVWRVFIAGCDRLHGNDAQILTNQASRFSAPPAGLSEGLGMGIDANGGFNNGPVGYMSLLFAEDFSRPSGDFGRAMACVVCGGQGCSPSLTNGYSWPMLATNTTNPSGVRSVNGSIIYLDPTFSIPAGWPDWEKRLYRTYQRYGCYMYDDLATSGQVAIRVEGTWSKELPGGGWDTNGNGTNAWEGLLTFNENGALFPPNRDTVAPHMKVKQMNGAPQTSVGLAGFSPQVPTLSTVPNAPTGVTAGATP